MISFDFTPALPHRSNHMQVVCTHLLQKSGKNVHYELKNKFFVVTLQAVENEFFKSSAEIVIPILFEKIN